MTPIGCLALPSTSGISPQSKSSMSLATSRSGMSGGADTPGFLSSLLELASVTSRNPGVSVRPWCFPRHSGNGGSTGVVILSPVAARPVGRAVEPVLSCGSEISSLRPRATSLGGACRREIFPGHRVLKHHFGTIADGAFGGGITRENVP